MGKGGGQGQGQEYCIKCWCYDWGEGKRRGNGGREVQGQMRGTGTEILHEMLF